jgi:hypothetical protein
MLERLQHALSRETVERPEQNEVELAFGGVPEQPLELWAVLPPNPSPTIAATVSGWCGGAAASGLVHRFVIVSTA